MSVKVIIDTEKRYRHKEYREYLDFQRKNDAIVLNLTAAFNLEKNTAQTFLYRKEWSSPFRSVIMPNLNAIYNLILGSENEMGEFEIAAGNKLSDVASGIYLVQIYSLMYPKHEVSAFITLIPENDGDVIHEEVVLFNDFLNVSKMEKKYVKIQKEDLKFDTVKMRRLLGILSTGTETPLYPALLGKVIQKVEGGTKDDIPNLIHHARKILMECVNYGLMVQHPTTTLKMDRGGQETKLVCSTSLLGELSLNRWNREIEKELDIPGYVDVYRDETLNHIANEGIIFSDYWEEKILNLCPIVKIWKSKGDTLISYGGTKILELDVNIFTSVGSTCFFNFIPGMTLKEVFDRSNRIIKDALVDFLWEQMEDRCLFGIKARFDWLDGALKEKVEINESKDMSKSVFLGLSEISKKGKCIFHCHKTNVCLVQTPPGGWDGDIKDNVTDFTKFDSKSDEYKIGFLLSRWNRYKIHKF